MQIEVAQYKESSKALGPGNRFILWVQGCYANCQNCISPSHKEFGKGTLMDINELAEKVEKNKTIEGVTISGGEPMEQIQAINLWIEKIKQCRQNINFILYTGYEFETVINSNKKAYLGNIDVLICGPYVDKLNDGKGIRGSSNQKIVFLSNRLIQYKNYFTKSERILEISVNEESLEIIGIPDKKFITNIHSL